MVASLNSPSDPVENIVSRRSLGARGFAGGWSAKEHSRPPFARRRGSSDQFRATSAANSAGSAARTGEDKCQTSSGGHSGSGQAAADDGLGGAPGAGSGGSTAWSSGQGAIAALREVRQKGPCAARTGGMAPESMHRVAAGRGAGERAPGPSSVSHSNAVAGRAADFTGAATRTGEDKRQTRSSGRGGSSRAVIADGLSEAPGAGSGGSTAWSAGQSTIAALREAAWEGPCVARTGGIAPESIHRVAVGRGAGKRAPGPGSVSHSNAGAGRAANDGNAVEISKHSLRGVNRRAS